MKPRPSAWVVATIATVNLALSGFAGYGLYTRAGPVTFDRGGAFGAEPIKTATARPTATTSARARGSATAGARPTTAVAGKRTTTRGGTVFTFPREGTYRYAGRGREEVHYGFAPACGWDIRDVTVVRSHEGDELTADWNFSDERKERHIDELRDDGLYRVFVGASVTCAGVRNKSNGDYSPPALSIPLPTRAGFTWNQTCSTEDRTEKISGRVVARETVTVPAGRFDAWHIRLDGTLSGGQTGTYRLDVWFAPAIGVAVQTVADLDARSGDARFRSEMTLKLSALPS
jgi:hypothetical protein